MSWQSQFDREMQMIEDDYMAGELTSEEYDKERNLLEREYRACAEDSAAEKYQNELNNWYDPW